MDNKIHFFFSKQDPFPSSLLKGVVMDRNKMVCFKLAKIQSLIHYSVFSFSFSHFKSQKINKS